MSDALERIGWMLVHSLWEETLVGIVAWLGYLCLRAFSASTRYNFLCGCLLVCGLAPMLTWFWLGTLDWDQKTKLIAFSVRSGQGDTRLGYNAVVGPAVNYVRLNWLFHQWLRFAAGGWGVFVSFLVLRTINDHRELSRLIASGRPIPRKHSVERRYVARLTALSRRMGIQRTVLLLESALIDVPSVVGWFKPIVLVPVAFLGSLPADQIEAILAHELAHVRRCDHIVNLLQIALETLLFYHPTVRWISRLLREERENCCDDIVVSTVSDKATYVSALAAVAERTLLPNTVALAANGGSLIKRVRRVLGTGESDEMRGVVLARQAYVGMLLGVLMFGLCFAIFFTVDRGSVVQHVDRMNLSKALVVAASNGDIPAMEALVQKGADVNQNVPPYEENALFAAASHNHLAGVELLLRDGASIDAKSDWGMSPMDWALAAGNFSMVKFMHDNGARISRGAWAAITDDVGELRAIYSGAELTSSQKDELMKDAASMGHLNAVQLLEQLMGKKIEGKFLSDAASAGNIPMMAYILRQGANIHTDGQKALEQAVLFYDKPEAAEFLLERGADPNRFTPWRKYLLSGVQSSAMVKVLLRAGANPNSEDRWGTPLSAAPDAESVRLLVGAGASLHPVLRSGMSLVESAVSHDRYDKADVLRELVRQGAAFNPQGNGVGALALAASHDKVNMMKCLLDLGVSPNAFLNASFWQTSVMRSAVIVPSIDAVKLLLERGGTPHGDSRDGITPSSLALQSGNADVVTLLGEGGARDLDKLSMAAASGDLEQVRRLIGKGADINQRDLAGHTPLFYAQCCGRAEVVRFLIQRGAALAADEVSPDSR